MPTTLSLPRISTNVRFAASAVLFPELAGAWAERLFLTPPRNGGAGAALDLIDARASLFEHKGRYIATWRWGSGDAPAVILAHGWGGHAPRLRAQALVIHDRDDRHVPWTQGAQVAHLWPGARLMSTDGLGHGRILADDAVTRAAADFIAGRSAVAPIAAQTQPAPLY